VAGIRILQCFVAACVAALAAVFPVAAVADIDSMGNFVIAPNSVGLGMMVRTERSMYQGVGVSHDLVPLYLYESEWIFMRPTRMGTKIFDDGVNRFEGFFDFRLEGFPRENVPASLAGMALRQTTTDVGISYSRRTAWGTIRGEYVHDALNITQGDEFRLGYTYDWHSGPWHLQPGITVKRRSADLNNYYYGVRPEEATANRPAYMPGAGTDIWLGMYGMYAFTGGWRFIGGLGYTLVDPGVRRSPVVVDSNRPTVYLGAAYDFEVRPNAFDAKSPLFVKLLYGQSTRCQLNRILRFDCGSADTTNETAIAGVELGRPLVTRLNNWPVDVVGYIGLLRHDERGFQDNFSEFNAFMKAYYYGFPWDEKVKTRIGIGAGVSFAERVSYIEASEQARKGRTTSRVLNYLDPTIDVSLGDLIGSRSLKETYVGVGVSHRSGFFGSSRMLGNVDGGSNYVYTYVEWKMQ
jgi:outer membrane protein